MKLLLRVFAVGALLTAVQTFAAAFEGKVTFTISSEKGKVQAMNYSMKEGALRMDIDAEGHSVSTIMDMGKREMTILMPEQRMYMVRPMPQPAEHPAAAAGHPGPEPDIERTGKTETILGYSCEQIVVRDNDKGTTTELWIAQNIGMFMGMGGGGGGGGMFGGRKPANSAAAAKWEEVLKGKGGFPLRVVSRDAKGKEVFKMEVTKIEPGHLSDSLFTPPEDYKQFQMPNLGDMFKRG